MAQFYEILFGRRDVRSEFIDKSIPVEALARVLTAAHHAPSVGLSQPWNFLLVESPEKKHAVHDAFEDANAEAAQQFGDERRDLYRSLKLQGILDAPLNILVTCDRQRGGEVVLGRTHQRDMDLYSTVCAVQNLWLAARAEDIGVGWVSIIAPDRLVELFGLPEQVVPVAYLCLGYVSRFRDNPELQERGWDERLPVADMVFNNNWGEYSDEHPLFDALSELRDWPRTAAAGKAGEGDEA